MNTYNIHVSDADNGSPVLASLYLLSSDGGSGILINGQPSAFQTDANGDYSFQTDASPLYVRIQSTGYVSKNYTLQPGNNNLTLSGVAGPTALITAPRTFWNKYKTLLLLLLAIALVMAAVKFKVWNV